MIRRTPARPAAATSKHGYVSPETSAQRAGSAKKTSVKTAKSTKAPGRVVEIDAKTRAHLDATQVTNVAHGKTSGLPDALRLQHDKPGAANAKEPAAVAEYSPEFRALQPLAKEAYRFGAALSPRLGVAMSYDDHAKLPDAAQAVLSVFDGVANHINSRAFAFGVDSMFAAHGAVSPRDAEAALTDALAPFGKDAGDTAKILLNASRTKDLSADTKSALRDSAARWSHKSSDPGWTAANALPKVTSERNTVLDPALERFRERAESIWDNAPRARGYRESEGRREITLRVESGSRHGVDMDFVDRRAFTHEEWMRHGPAEMLRAAKDQDERDALSIPAWRQ